MPSNLSISPYFVKLHQSSIVVVVAIADVATMSFVVAVVSFAE